MSHFKIGVLALVTVAAVVAMILIFGVRTSPTDRFHTYFDESVHGLDVGSLVKFRGVKIGTVGVVDIAPDHKLVHVALDVDRETAHKLDLVESVQHLRTRLTTIGVTGLKLIEIHAVESGAPPPVVLHFPPLEPYIPSDRSLSSTLEHHLDVVAEKVPDIVDRIAKTLDTLDAIAESAQREKLPQRIGQAVDAVRTASTQLRDLAKKLDPGDLPKEIRGLVDSARRATESVAEVGNTISSSADVERTLRDVRDAARAMRGFFELLERQPDMILKGRRQ
ncbi:MAG: MCE family protein [Deltaproteobacteria bacterium]|nr:MCE family protein [Deltaproteobacteria bacterium]